MRTIDTMALRPAVSKLARDLEPLDWLFQAGWTDAEEPEEEPEWLGK